MESRNSSDCESLKPTDSAYETSVRESSPKGFEGVCSMSLAGAYVETSKENQCEAANRVTCAVLEGMRPGQSLEVVYRILRENSRGSLAGANIFVKGHGSTAEEAVKSVGNLTHNISSAIGLMERSLFFEPEHRPSKGHMGKGKFKYHIMPQGITIFMNLGKIGFGEQRQAEGELILSSPARRSVRLLDSALVTAITSGATLDISIRVSAFSLSAFDINTLKGALKIIKQHECGPLLIRDGDGSEVADTAEIEALQRDLEMWINSAGGYATECLITSDKSLSNSILSLIGGEIFHGRAIRVMPSSSKRETKASSGKFELNGCFCIPSASPPLFSSGSAIVDSGFKKYFAPSAERMADKGVLLGWSGDGRFAQAVRFPEEDRGRHCYIVGATGSGKSTLLHNMIVQDIRDGKGVAVIDPHGDLFAQALDSIPKSRLEDVVIIDPSDSDYPVGINFLDTDGADSPAVANFLQNEMIKIFDRLYNMKVAGGPMFEQYMRNAMMLVMENDVKGASLMDVVNVFEDQSFRGFMKSKCLNPLVRSFWENVAEKAGGDASLANMAPYITSKLNQFTNNAVIRPIIGQSRSTVDFRWILDERKILLVNLAKGRLGEMDTQLLGMLIIGKIFGAAMGRLDIPQAQRTPFHLFIDEFQNFTTDTVAHLLSESRKFGLRLTLANQNLTQLSTNSGSQNILDAVLGNVGTTLLFRLGAADAVKLETYLKPEFSAQDLQYLPDFHVATRLLNDHKPLRPFVMKTESPIAPSSDCADRTRIITASRNKYSVTRTQAEQEIVMRRYIHLAKKAGEAKSGSCLMAEHETLDRVVNGSSKKPATDKGFN